MTIAERKDYIMHCLAANSSVSVAELAQQFGISEVSVRKLLDSMEKEGMVRRTWGGAVSQYSSLHEYNYREKAAQHHPEKVAIAAAAYDLIEDGDAVFLDNGTTVLELAKQIVGGPKRNLMVCTNTLDIAMELSKCSDLTIILTGRTLRTNVMSCVGPLTMEALAQLTFDKYFASCNRFTLEHGFSTPNLSEAEVKRQMRDSSKEVIMLADMSKLGDNSLAQIMPISDADVLVTDWHAGPDFAESLRSRNVQLICGTKPEGKPEGSCGTGIRL